MNYRVIDVIGDLEGMLHGTSTNKVTNLYGVLSRAGRNLMLDIDPQETKRFSTLFPVFQSIYDYELPEDVKGNRIFDLRPTGARYLRDNPTQNYSKTFDMQKGYTIGPSFTVEYDSTNRFMRINYPQVQAGTIMAYQQTDDGTWALSGTASNLQQDNLNYVLGNGSLSFDATAGTATITAGSLGSFDLSTLARQTDFFQNVYLPTGSACSSMELRVGSSASDYWSITATTPINLTAFQDGWNQVFFDWSTATQVGSPDNVAITYSQLNINLTSDQVGLHVNGLSNKLGVGFTIGYYSKYLFRSPAGVWTDTLPSDATEANQYYINLDTDSINIYLNQAMLLCVQQLLGSDATYDTSIFQTQYLQGVEKYKMLYPSETIKTTQTYYRQNGNNYRNLWGRGPIF